MKNCGCGQKFSVDHERQWTSGGLIHKRHDRVKDIVPKILDSVAYDVQIEPALQPLTGEVLGQGKIQHGDSGREARTSKCRREVRDF